MDIAKRSFCFYFGECVCVCVCVCVCARALSCSVVSSPFRTTRLLCPWGFSRQEYWSEVAVPSPRGSSQPRDRTQVSHIVGGLYCVSHQGSPFWWIADRIYWVSKFLPIQEMFHMVLEISFTQFIIQWRFLLADCLVSPISTGRATKPLRSCEYVTEVVRELECELGPPGGLHPPRVCMPRCPDWGP